MTTLTKDHWAEFAVKEPAFNDEVSELFTCYKDELIGLDSLCAGLWDVEKRIKAEYKNRSNLQYDYPYQLWFRFSTNGISTTIWDLKRMSSQPRIIQQQMNERIVEGCHGVIRAFYC